MVRVVVVGAGFWGVNHLRVLKEIPRVEIEAICEIDKARGEDVAKRFGIQSYYTDVDEMLKSVEPEAATICTPSTTHAKIALKLLDAGCDVLIEKPMATTVDEAIKILEHKERAGVNIMVGFVERFNPVVKQARKLIDKGEIGNIILFYSRRIGSWPERIGDTGVVKDTAIHDIDLATWFFNSLPDTVYSICGRLKHSHEDHAQIFLSFGADKSAMIEANWLTPRKKREMHITGENGVVTVKFIEQELVLEKAEQVTIPIIKFTEPLKSELEHFIECVKYSRKPSVDGFDGLKATLIAECVLRSATLKQTVKVREVIAKTGLDRYIDQILS